VALSTGVRLGPYEILGSLGAGGMGEVYRARDSRLRREVAIKVLPSLSGGSKDAIARFHREMQAVAALSHPHILAIHDVGEDNGAVYAVMELLEGETLRSRLSASAIPARKAVDYALQISKGLAAAHDRGIVHRDLKPENIFLTDSGFVKILDFGLAMLSARPSADVELSQSPTIGTQPGIVLGTPGYMSPEQVRGRKVDHRTDLFALGAILYEMLTGRRAFHAQSAAEAMLAVLQEDPMASTTSAQISPELGRIVSHCLEKDAAERFQSARDLGFALTAWESAATPSSAPVISGPAEPAEASIAVLPFRNMSADAEAEYFSDGITEEIISMLSGIGPMRVAARTSSFAFKGKDTDVRQIGRELGVRTVLEGSVRKAGRRLRITAQLIDVASGYHLFSERYDREMEDVFAVQDEIARAIAETLQIRLTGKSDPAGVPPPTKDLVAYDSFLKGRYDWNLRRLRSAVAHFRAAVDRDPDYAAAHLALADSYAVWGFYGGMPCWEAFARARTAAESAARIEPDSAGVHLSFGIIEHYYGWDTAHEESELRLAAEKEPRSADPYTWLALCWAVCGRLEEALDSALKAVEREPHSANAVAVHGWVYAGSRRFGEALPILEKAVALEPDAAFPRWSLGLVQRYAGKLPEAIATLETAVVSTHREHTFQLGLLCGALAEAGRADAARGVLAELIEKSSRSYVPPFDLAISYVGLGEKARALDALERAFDERNGLLWYRIHMPMLDPLRDEPRYRVIADRLARLAPMRPGGGW
jgi:eukaryotic-like serine/threonine-protein kinase